jgi:hypothetical protein
MNRTKPDHFKSGLGNLHPTTAKGGGVSHQYRDQSGSGSLTPYNRQRRRCQPSVQRSEWIWFTYTLQPAKAAVSAIDREITADYMRVHLHAITAKGGGVSY